MGKSFTYPLLFLALCAISFSGCKTKGCTDPKASNFNYDAVEDDGSCEYLGCTDEDALNYDSDAKVNDGSCQYLGDVKFVSDIDNLTASNVILSVSLNNNWIGYLYTPCIDPPILDCDAECEMISLLQQPAGYNTVSYYLLTPINNNLFDTLAPVKTQTFNVLQKQCIVVNLN